MFDICVIGAGSIGSSAAYHLSKVPDLNVCLVGPGEPEVKQLSGEVFGCHYDEGRITRVVSDIKTEQILAYRSTLKYKTLEQESGLKIFTEVGFGVVGSSNEEGLQTINQMADAFCEKSGITCVKLDEAVIKEKWGYFSPPANCTGRFVKELNGYISIRNLVKACQLVAGRNGVVRKDTVARRLTRTPGADDIQITLGDGTTISSKKVIIACGSFTNFFDLLHKQLELQLTGHTVMKFEISDQDYNTMAEFPSMSYRYNDAGDYVYVLPPIVYPNGRRYVKLGHCAEEAHKLSKSLHTLEEVKKWYCMSDFPDARTYLQGHFGRMFPDLSYRSSELDHCVIARTSTGKQYIGFCEAGVFLAAGGNGTTAKMALEIGHICSASSLEGTWNYDLNESDFRIVYKS